MTDQQRQKKRRAVRWSDRQQGLPRDSKLRIWSVRLGAVALGVGILFAFTANWDTEPPPSELAARAPDTSTGAAARTPDEVTLRDTVEAVGKAHPKLAPLQSQGVPDYGDEARSDDEPSDAVNYCIEVEGSNACTLPPSTIAAPDFAASHGYGVGALTD